MPSRTKRSGSVTIVDVARAANVSYSTVSRVINEYPHVAADKRERVLEAMTRLGYVANPHARSLAGGRTQVVGLVLPDLLSEYTAQVLLGVDEALVANRYDLMIYTTHHRPLRESTYIRMLTQGMIDGLLLLLPMDPGAYLSALHEKQFPYVVIDHQGFDTYSPTVAATNLCGAYEATAHLIGLGHRRVAFVTGTSSTSTSRERLEGYRQALAEAGIAFDEDLVESGEFTQPGGFQAALKLLKLSEPPTAIFAANDHSAFGVIEAIHSRGLTVPGDISVVGFDDVPRAGYTHPALTTVRQPLVEMGQTAVRLLLQYIRGPELPMERIVLGTELVIRESSAPPR